EAVAKRQPVARRMHAAEAAIDDMRLVDERVLLIEGEELLRDIDIGVILGGDLCEQVQSAAIFLVEDGAWQVVSVRRVTIQKKPAAQLVLGLVDRDVWARNVGVPVKQRRRRETAEPAADDMRLHVPLRGPAAFGSAGSLDERPVRSRSALVSRAPSSGRSVLP